MAGHGRSGSGRTAVGVPFTGEHDMKRFVLLIMGVIMLFGLFGCKDKNKDGNNGKGTAEQGTCGSNITWEYDKESATLTISGTGAMEGEKFLWSDYKIKKLVISDSQTERR